MGLLVVTSLGTVEHKEALEMLTNTVVSCIRKYPAECVLKIFFKQNNT